MKELRERTRMGSEGRNLAFGLTLLFVAAASASCAADDENTSGGGLQAETVADAAMDLHDEAEPHAEDEAEGPLEIPVDAQRNAGMRVVTVDHRELPVPMTVTGFVAPDTSRVVRLRPLADGVVNRVDVQEGDRVRAGQVLVEYDNVALGDHIGEYRSAIASRSQAEADLDVLRRSFERAEQLIALEAIAQQTVDLRRSEFEQAQARLVSAQAEISRIEERIHRFGLTDDDLLELAPGNDPEELRNAAERHREMSLNVLRAPFDGVVTEYSVAMGDLITPERELMTITDISTVWVLADVYEPDLGRLPANAEVAIRVDAYPDRQFMGRLTYVSDTIEAATRAAHVRLVVENADATLKIGMFAEATIPTNESVSALAAPIDAVQTIDGQTVVFAQIGPTTFERRDVALGSGADGFVEVLEGVASGESIVSNGSFYLKTAVLHERIGHSH